MKVKLTLLAMLLLGATALSAQDYGDAPAPYPTCMHLDQSQGTRIDVIGFTVGDDGYIATSRVAGGFNGDYGDDGLQFINFNKGGVAQITVRLQQSYNTNDLCVWMDFNNDGTWDASERVIWAGFSSSAPNGSFAAPLNASVNTYNVNIPSTAVGATCKVRARFWDTASHSSGPMAANGGGSVSAVSDYGECEDHEIPYGASTGSKADVSVYDLGTSQPTTQVPRNGTDNRGNLTAGVQSTIYYAFRNRSTATYALQFTNNPTTTIVAVSNCSVTAFIVPASGLAVTPDDNSHYVIIFGITPTTAGSPFSATITMYVNEPGLPTYAWSVTGNAVAPAPKMEIQRPAYTLIPKNSTDNVGSVPTGSGQTFTWYLFNNGTATLNLTGSPYVQLSAFSNCNATVTAQPYPTLSGGGWSTTFDILIVPSSSASFSFQVSIASNDAGANPYVFTVAGNGGSSGGSPNMSVQRPVGTTIANGGNDNLGSLNAGAGSSFTYTIANTGTGTLLLNGTPLVALSNISNCSVSVTSQPAASVAPSGSTSYVVLVTPTAAGAFSFRMTIANTDAAKNPYIVNVSGTASSTAAPSIDVQRPVGATITNGGTDSAGSLPVGTATTLTYTVANLGTASLTITSTTTGSQSNCTAAVGAAPASNVGTGSSTSFTVNVTPSAVGAFSFTVSIVNNDSAKNPYTFTVSGNGIVNGPEIDVQRPVGASKASGSTDNVGSVAFGVNLTLVYTIANTGNQTLNLTGSPVVAVTGASNCTAAVTTMPGTSVPAGISASFTVSYTVSGVGAFSFMLSIANNDADENPYTITVNGTGGTLPDISVRLQSVTLTDGGNANIGNVNVNTPVLLSFTISNVGNAPLNLTGPLPVATGGTSNCTAVVTVQPGTLTLAPGGQTTFTVEVTAASLSTLSFTVSVASDDPDENPFNFTVNGAGSTFTIGGNGGAGGGGGCSSAESFNLSLACLLVSALAGLWLRRRRLMA